MRKRVLESLEKAINSYEDLFADVKSEMGVYAEEDAIKFKEFLKIIQSMLN